MGSPARRADKSRSQIRGPCGFASWFLWTSSAKTSGTGIQKSPTHKGCVITKCRAGAFSVLCSSVQPSINQSTSTHANHPRGCSAAPQAGLASHWGTRPPRNRDRLFEGQVNNFVGRKPSREVSVSRADSEARGGRGACRRAQAQSAECVQSRLGSLAFLAGATCEVPAGRWSPGGPFPQPACSARSSVSLRCAWYDFLTQHITDQV